MYYVSSLPSSFWDLYHVHSFSNYTLDLLHYDIVLYSRVSKHFPVSCLPNRVYACFIYCCNNALLHLVHLLLCILLKDCKASCCWSLIPLHWFNISHSCVDHTLSSSFPLSIVYLVQSTTWWNYVLIDWFCSKLALQFPFLVCPQSVLDILALLNSYHV